VYSFVVHSLVVSHAFIDESARSGKYLLTAAVVPTMRLQEVTKVIQALVLKGNQRVNLSDESNTRRTQILRAYVALDVPARVAVTAHAGGDDKPARDRCLRALLAGFAELKVQVVLLDTRDEHRNTEDRRVIARAVREGAAPELQYDHRRSRSEPLLSLPDAFGWAHGAGGTWRTLVASVVTVIEA